MTVCLVQSSSSFIQPSASVANNLILNINKETLAAVTARFPFRRVLQSLKPPRDRLVPSTRSVVVASLSARSIGSRSSRRGRLDLTCQSLTSSCARAIVPSRSHDSTLPPHGCMRYHMHAHPATLSSASQQGALCLCLLR